MPQKKIGFNDSQLKADKLIIHNGLTASATLEFVGANPITFRLPQAAGTAGQAMITDGVGNLSFATMSGAASQNLTQTLLLGNTASVPILHADGSAATPSISFSADTDTGLFRRTGDELNFSIGGTELLRLDADPGAGKLQILNNGSAAAVALGINDNNTGLFRAGTDELSISAGGVESGRFMTQSFRLRDGTTTLPGISFILDQDTGMFRQATNVVSISAGGVESGRFTTQSFRAQNGSADIPSISFINSTGTGLHTASNELRLSANGVLAQQVSSVASRFLDGSTATPSISFIGDSDTGFFRVSGNIIGVASNGVRTVAFQSNLTRFDFPVVALDGVAATPAFSFTNDTDTGIFRPTANQLAISAGGLTASVFDGSTTAGETRLLLFDVDSGTIKRVSVGATDSGGVGFKTLRIPN